jgi:hypothetical protein
MKKLKAYLVKTSENILKFFTPIMAWWQRVVSPVLTRVNHRLRHNVIYREKGHNVVFFSFINITITRKRRHALYGYLFISLWMIGSVIFTLYPLIYSFYLSFHQAYYNLQQGCCDHVCWFPKLS